VALGGDAGQIATGDGDEYVGIATVTQFITTGIDSDATSTTVQAVIRVCGL
jgi:uncharacterized membrane protein